MISSGVDVENNAMNCCDEFGLLPVTSGLSLRLVDMVSSPLEWDGSMIPPIVDLVPRGKVEQDELSSHF